MTNVEQEHQELMESFNSLKTAIKNAHKEGMDVSFPKEKLRMVASALKAKDYDAASKKIVECQDELDVLHRSQTVRDIMNMGDCLIKTAENLGIDTSEAEKGMEIVKKHLEDRAYMEALQVATKTAGTVDALCKKNVEALFFRLDPMIMEAKANEIDVITVEALYQKAKEYQRKHQYDKAARYAKRCFDEIQEIEDKSQRAASIIRLAEGNVLQAKFFGAKVGSVQMILDEAYYELKSGQYDTSIKLGKECIKMANQAKENVVWDTVISFQAIIDQMKNEGVDTSTAKKLVEDAMKTLKDMDNTTALELLMQSESETGKTEWQEKMLKELITGMEALIKEAEKRGIAIKHAQRFHRKAESAVNNRQYAHALESIIESGFELSEAQEMFVKAKTFLFAAEARISEANSSHACLEENRELRKSAGSAFSERDYEAAIKISKEIIANVKQATASDLLLPIRECEQLIEKARTLGLDVTRARTIVDEARFALEEGLYSKVKPFTQNCKKVIEREMSSVLYKELFNLKTNLGNAKGNGVDISEAEALLEEAEESLENKEYPIAAQLCQEVKEMVANY
jgi:tetratricopeptide (TPR) repeat protein